MHGFELIHYWGHPVRVPLLFLSVNGGYDIKPGRFVECLDRQVNPLPRKTLELYVFDPVGSAFAITTCILTILQFRITVFFAGGCYFSEDFLAQVHVLLARSQNLDRHTPVELGAAHGDYSLRQEVRRDRLDDPDTLQRDLGVGE